MSFPGNWGTLWWGSSAAQGVGRAGVTTLQGLVSPPCDKGLLSVHNILAEQQTCPRTFQCSSERGAGKRNEIFASRKGSGFGSSEVGLGLFAKISQLAKMLVLDFITVTGLRAFH